MYLLNQDRDEVYEFDFEKDVLRSLPVFFGGEIFAYNLMFGNNILGTFDTLQDLMNEIELISQSKDSFWEISGYSDFNIMEVIYNA